MGLDTSPFSIPRLKLSQDVPVGKSVGGLHRHDEVPDDGLSVLQSNDDPLDVRISRFIRRVFDPDLEPKL